MQKPLSKILPLLLTVCLLVSCHSGKNENPKYIFYFIGDGMGHNQIALTEAWLASTTGAGDSVGFIPLNFTQFPAYGIATSHCATRRITDSAAAGTALATGEKSSVGTIGMNASWETDLKSIAVSCKEAGMATGVITSVSIDHATPASFYAHEKNRDRYYQIGRDLPASGLNLFAGAGLLKPEEGEHPDLFTVFQKTDYHVTRGEDSLRGRYSILLQTDNYPASALPLAIDAKEKDFTLPELTRRAIDYLYNLQKEHKQGFFLMAEGGQIDWMGHDNDAAGLVHETVDFANAIEAALAFYREHPHETLIVVTADHETGGMTLGRGERGYDTHFELLSAQTCSGKILVKLINRTKSWPEAKILLEEKVGLGNRIKINATEWKALEEAYKVNPSRAANKAVQLVSLYAGVGWTSGTHTAAYIPIFAIGTGHEHFNGRMDNTDIALKMKLLISKE